MAFSEGITVGNPLGLVWERERQPYLYRGDKALAYVAEYVADLAYLAAPPDSYASWFNSVYMNLNADYSAIPQDKLPFELRTTPPSFMEYIQAFYLLVADKADTEAKAKLEEIKDVNNRLSALNAAISLAGELDARTAEDAKSDKVKEAMVAIYKERWLEGSVSNDYVYAKFEAEYQTPLNNAKLDPSVQGVNINRDSDGAAVARASRALQAEATRIGNLLQTLMTEASSKISFQSAVNEGYKSFTDRWFQMLNQTTSNT